MRWFDKFGDLMQEIPQECVRDCSHQGDCYEDTKYWCKKLEFSVPRNKGFYYLLETGGWTRRELLNLSDEEMALRILWIACCYIKEQLARNEEPFFHLGV